VLFEKARQTDILIFTGQEDRIRLFTAGLRELAQKAGNRLINTEPITSAD
jgi:hypothetical protein